MKLKRIRSRRVWQRQWLARIVIKLSLLLFVILLLLIKLVYFYLLINRIIKSYIVITYQILFLLTTVIFLLSLKETRQPTTDQIASN